MKQQHYHFLDAIRYAFEAEKWAAEQSAIYKALPWYKKIFTKRFWKNLLKSNPSMK